MDLSAIIFVVLALAWAVYLIPKALKHHDELASDRLVEGHSDRVRILSRHGRATVVETSVEVDTVEPVLAEKVLAEKAPSEAPGSQARPPVTRAVARKAAQRRRRVLGLLVLVLGVVWALTWFAQLPIWAPGVPGALVVAWLVLARLSVRRMHARHAPVAPVDVVDVVDVVAASQVDDHAARPTGVPVPSARAQQSQDLVDLLSVDTVGVPRQEIEAALASEGSLWDPLPLTLPTYVNKARARRTVRTIELTGINSSGHDQADTTLAREAGETAEPDTTTQSGQRKVAGA